MWLSEMAALGGRETAPACETGVVTIGGEKPSVLLAGEKRGVSVASPGGFIWRPAAGQQVLVAQCGGEYFVTGVADQKAPDGAQAGEVYIKTDSASVKLGADGTIELTGKVNVRGELYLNGVNILSLTGI